MALLPQRPMETIPAREAKNAFGRLLDTAQRGPVAIAKHGRPVVVVLSTHAYEAMQRDAAALRSELETAHLLADPANRRRLLDAIASSGHEVSLDDLAAYAD